ncbi:tetratricopeptide repeat protein [Consotaella aegiceratis]|uniref:tetratricopeptide repeat protein n=1 Tax=Consotaella aegiceratis TaxID=3097961 RepID=UPI002F3EE1B4
MTKVSAALALAAVCVLSSCRSDSLEDAVGSITRPNPSSIEDVKTGDLIREGKRQFKAKNYGRSYALFKKSAEVYPQNPAAWLGLAASADQLSRFDTADEAYRALALLTPDSAEYFNNLGYSYLLRGDLNAAQTNLMRASALAPDNLTIANNLQLMRNSTSLAGHG